MKKGLLIGFFLLFASVAVVFAFDGYIDITNSTGYTIYYLYVSHEDADTWEEDVLEDEVLLDGETYRVTVNGYASPVFDVRVEDEDGDTYTFWDVDVEEFDLDVTLDYLDE